MSPELSFDNTSRTTIELPITFEKSPPKIRSYKSTEISKARAKARAQAYRARMKALKALQPPKKPPKTSAERVREYRARKKALNDPKFEKPKETPKTISNSKNSVQKTPRKKSNSKNNADKTPKTVSKNSPSNYCYCCRQREKLSSMLELHDFQGISEIYADIILECFDIEIRTEIKDLNKNSFFLCENCVFRLRGAAHLRYQIRSAYFRIAGEDENVTVCNMKEETDLHCFCCSAEVNLFSILEPGENGETYAFIITECFRIELHASISTTKKDKLLMCSKCIKRLNDAVHFRFELQTSHVQLTETEEFILPDDTKIPFCSNSEEPNATEFDKKPQMDILSQCETESDITRLNNEKNTIKFSDKVPDQYVEFFFCDHCNKVFPDSRVLQKHLKSHKTVVVTATSTSNANTV